MVMSLPGSIFRRKNGNFLKFISLLTEYEDVIDKHASLMPEHRRQLQAAINEVRTHLYLCVLEDDYDKRLGGWVTELHDGLVDIRKPNPEYSSIRAAIAKLKEISDKLRLVG
jgi:hypothetical protein